MRIGDLDWDDEELDLLEEDARAWMKQTGRRCVDFFRTLGRPGHPEGRIAGRATLLAKTRTMNDATRLQLSNTMCAIIEPPVVARVPARAVAPSGAQGVRVTFPGIRGVTLPANFTTTFQEAEAWRDGIIRAYGARAGSLVTITPV